MFSVKEKQAIADTIEKVLLELKHPEMPKDKPDFTLHVNGKESYSFADILPNHTYSKKNPPSINPFNELSREIYEGQKWIL